MIKLISSIPVVFKRFEFCLSWCLFPGCAVPISISILSETEKPSHGKISFCQHVPVNMKRKKPNKIFKSENDFVGNFIQHGHI